MKSSVFGRVHSLIDVGMRLALIGGLLAVAPVSSQSGIAPARSRPEGRSYAQWSVKYWQWSLQLPVAGHPFTDSPAFDVTAGQHGDVWFLAPVLDTVTRTVTIPQGKSLFVGMVTSEWSTLEGYATLQDQRDAAIYFGNHIVGSFCELDGVSVNHIDRFRVTSPQFSFTAPSPWIFGDVGGTGTTVADGYYVFIEDLSVGQHVLHYGGSFHFAIAEGDPFDLDVPMDMTYVLNVAARCDR